MDEEERQLVEMLELLRDSYQKAMQPLLSRLTTIRLMRPPEPIIVNLEQAREWGLIPREEKR